MSKRKTITIDRIEFSLYKFDLCLSGERSMCPNCWQTDDQQRLLLSVVQFALWDELERVTWCFQCTNCELHYAYTLTVDEFPELPPYSNTGVENYDGGGFDV